MPFGSFWDARTSHLALSDARLSRARRLTDLDSIPVEDAWLTLMGRAYSYTPALRLLPA